MNTQPTYRVVIEYLLVAAPIHRTIHEGVHDFEHAFELTGISEALDRMRLLNHHAELTTTGRTTLSYGFTDATIERE